MKGILTKRSGSWYITHTMEDNGVKFGVDYEINPALVKYYFLDKDSEGCEIEFELVTIDNGDNGVRYARPIRSTQLNWDEVYEEYSTDQYPPFGGPFDSAMSLKEWLKKNFNITRK